MLGNAATGAVNALSTTTTSFDFQAGKDSYNRTRVALIVSFDGNRRVNIEAEDRVLRLIEFNTSRVVYIAA